MHRKVWQTIINTRSLWLLLALSLLLGLVIGTSTAYTANPPAPTYGTATVDGDDIEWLPSDWFADMHRAGKDSKPVESELYLRYDCSTNTLYVLVLGVGGPITDVNEDGEHWIKLDGAKKTAVNADSPNFEWVGLNVASDTAQGWEASVPLTEGDHTLNVHTNVWDDGESQTSATPKVGIVLEIACPCSGDNFVIGDFVWDDTSGINFSIQDAGEPGIDGVAMELYSDGGIIGVIDGTDAVISTTITSSGGWYYFTGLAAGTYIVKAADSNFQANAVLDPTDWAPVLKDQGLDDTIDSDGDQTTHTAAVSLTTTDRCDQDTDFGFEFIGTPTLITLSFFQATPVPDDGVRFVWQTEAEWFTAHFNLYVGEDEDNRTLINTNGPIEAAHFSLVPTTYDYTFDGVSGNQFWLEEVEMTGVPYWYGPFQLGLAYPPTPWPN